MDCSLDDLWEMSVASFFTYIKDGVMVIDRRRLSAQSNAKIQRRTRRVCVLGPSRSGKSCLVKRFLNNTFSEIYFPTIEECYNLDYVYKGYNLNLDVIDTCGAYVFPVMRDLNIKKADVIIATYEINNKLSIKESISICKKVLEIRQDVVPVILVGCKSDLNGEPRENNDYINEELNLLDPINIKHVLTSSKLNINVNDAFEVGFDDVIKIVSKKSLTSCENYFENPKKKKKINFCITC
ncbi:ras-like protein rasS isoform X3 [Hydra vulgaris]